MLSALRLWYQSIEHSVNLSFYCKELNINRSNLSQFLKGNNNVISYDKLLMLRDFIVDDLTKKIA